MMKQFFNINLSFRVDGEQMKSRLALDTNSTNDDLWGNSTTFSYADAPVPAGYLDTMTNVYVYSGKQDIMIYLLR